MLAALWILSGGAIAQMRTPSQGLGSPNPTGCQFFGKNVAAEKSWIIVGAHTCGVGMSPVGGSFSVYKRTGLGYQLHQHLGPSDPIQGGRFGENGIDIDSDVIVTSSAWWPDPFAPEGKVYVFERMGDSWFESQSLTIVASQFPQGYGASVAIDQGVIYVAAPQAGPILPSGNPSQRGAIYIYEKVGGTWAQSAIWTPPDEDQYNGLFAGGGLRVSGDSLTWGNFSDNELYILERDSNGVWGDPIVIPSLTSGINDQDGWRVAIDNDLIAVGVDESTMVIPGKVYIIHRNASGAWVLESVIQAPDSNGVGDGFGFSVDLLGNQLVVGAQGAGTLGNGGQSPGAAYWFERTAPGQWEFKSKLIHPDGDMWDALGSDVAIEKDYVVVGDRFGQLQTSHAGGLAFVYELPLGRTLCDGQDNSLGEGAHLEVTGALDPNVNRLTLSAQNLPEGLAGMFLAGRQSALLPMFGGSQGTLCVGGQLVRFNQVGQFGPRNQTGVRSLRLDTTQIGGTWGPPILPGETWIFQYWYRDLNPHSTTNFSSAVEMVFD